MTSRSDLTVPQQTLAGQSLRVQRLVRRFIRMFKCDTARITSPLGKHFLIIGHNRNTKDDPGVWMDEHGNRKDWDYVQEQVAASGDTDAELVASAKRYKQLCGMSMEQYLRSQPRTTKTSTSRRTPISIQTQNL